MTSQNAYQLLTNEAHRHGERGQRAAQAALQLGKALINQQGLTDIDESAQMLRAEAEKRQRGGLTANATALFYASRFLLSIKR